MIKLALLVMANTLIQAQGNHQNIGFV